jgi:hypothetical protein
MKSIFLNIKLISEHDQLAPTAGGAGGAAPLGAAAAAASAAALLVAGCTREELDREEIKERALWSERARHEYTYFGPRLSAAASETLQGVLSMNVLPPEEKSYLSMYNKTLFALGGNWDTVITDDSKMNGLLKRINTPDGKEAFFIREQVVAAPPDEKEPKDSLADISYRVVSEGSAYWLRTAAGMPYAGVSAIESRDFFIRLRRGVQMLANLPGCQGVFPAWAARITSDGRLVLDPSVSGPENSASDADHDYVMSLLAARANLQNGVWESTDELSVAQIDQELEKLLPVLLQEYTKPENGLYILKPSEDEAANRENNQAYYRLDYLSPETCFAIADYLRAKNNSLAAQWRTIGEDSMKIYLACLDRNNGGPGYVPAKAWVKINAKGGLEIQPNGFQSYDGIRAPSRIAVALPYLSEAWLAEHKAVAILTAYAQDWLGFTKPELDAAAYLPLAVQLGQTELAQAMARTLQAGMSAKGVYSERSSYYETSLIAKNLIELLYPYTPQRAAGQIIDESPSRLDAAGRRGKFEENGGGPFYRQFKVGKNNYYAYIANNDPVPITLGNGARVPLRDFVPSNYDVINSESLVYGLIDALADLENNTREAAAKERIEHLLNMIYALCEENYWETKTSLKLLPWAAMSNGIDVQIIQHPDVPNFGNASASDADLLLLAALIKLKEKKISGLGGLERLEYFIYQYADNFVSQDLAFAQDKAGQWQIIMKAAGFTSVRADPITGEPLYQINTSYFNRSAMQIIVQYFKRSAGSVVKTSVGKAGGLAHGVEYLSTIFTELQSSTESLFESIQGKYPSNADFPEMIYVRASRQNGLELITPNTVLTNWLAQNNLEDTEANREITEENPEYQSYAEKYQYLWPTVDIYASWRLPLGGFITGGDFQASFEREKDLSRYYHYYVDSFYKKVNFGQQINSSGKLDFTTMNASFDANDTLFNHGINDRILDHFTSHWILPLGQFTPHRDRMFPRDNYQPSPGYIENIKLRSKYKTTQPGNLYYSETKIGKVRDVFTFLGDGSISLNQGFEYAIGLSKSTEQLDKALLVYREMIIASMRLLNIGENTMIPQHGLPVNFDRTPLGRYSKKQSYVYIVQTYLQILDERGYDDAYRLQEINVLLAIASTKNISIDHPVVEALWFQKLLLWNSALSVYEKGLVEDMARHYGWIKLADRTTGELLPEGADLQNAEDIGILGRLKNPPNQAQAHRLIVDWERVLLDTSAEKLTLAALRNAQLENMFIFANADVAEAPTLLKNIVAEYIVRREVLAIIDRYRPAAEDSEATLRKKQEDLQKELIKYIKKQPEEYRKNCLVPILFSEEYTKDGVLYPDPVSTACKEYFIRDALENMAFYAIDPADKQNYPSTYKMLWEAYSLIQYREVDKILSRFKNNGDTITAGAVTELAAALNELIRAANLVKHTGLQPTWVATNPSEQKSIMQLLADKQGDALNDQKGYLFIGALRSIINELYWPAETLEQLLTDNPPYAVPDTDLAMHRDYYDRIKPAVLNLINWYKAFNPGWEQNIGLRVQVRSIELRESTMGQDIDAAIAELWELQRQAEIYGESEAYAQCKLAEALLYNKYPYYNRRIIKENGSENSGYDYY